MASFEYNPNRNKDISKERFEELFSRPTLHLNLTKKWFDKIYFKEKPEEYREIKQYWITRFFRFLKKDPLMGLSWPEGFNIFDANQDFEDLLKQMKSHGDLYKFIHYSNVFPVIQYDYSDLNKYRTITFSNGMAKYAPRFVIACKGFQVKEGKPEWGAKEGVSYFTFDLGEIVWSNFNDLPF